MTVFRFLLFLSVEILSTVFLSLPVSVQLLVLDTDYDNYTVLYACVSVKNLLYGGKSEPSDVQRASEPAGTLSHPFISCSCRGRVGNRTKTTVGLAGYTAAALREKLCPALFFYSKGCLFRFFRRLRHLEQNSHGCARNTTANRRRDQEEWSSWIALLEG